MGKRGPKPTPTAILNQRGSWRGKVNPAEPATQVAMPDRPAWLDLVAAEEWDRVAPRLLAQRIVSEQDRAALASYCHHWSLWQRCLQSLDGFELGSAEHRRVFTCANDAHDRMMRAAQEFGMTPSARSRVVVGSDDDKEKDGKSRFIRLAQ